jgi:hypothetical protein
MDEQPQTKAKKQLITIFQEVKRAKMLIEPYFAVVFGNTSD